MKEYQKWKYGYSKSTAKFLLEHDKGVLPKYLFKYYSLNKYSVDALVNMYVYASHPAQLNDPFDCDENLARIEDQQSARALWNEFYEQARSTYKDEQTFLDYSTRVFSTLMYRKWGVLSLASSIENEILWARYAKNNGLCVEFDYSKFPFHFSGPFPIHYVKSVTHASSIQYDLQELVLIQSNVKQLCWQNEDEYRLLVHSPEGFDLKAYGKDADLINTIPGTHNRCFYYPINAVKSITLGINFFKNETDNGRAYSLSNNELHVFYHEECMQTQVLDYLEKIKQYTIIRMRIKMDLIPLIIPIDIVKINPLTYRIIEI